jgi:hypothetical protein
MQNHIIFLTKALIFQLGFAPLCEAISRLHLKTFELYRNRNKR